MVKNKRLIAILTLIVMIFNMFSPYTLLVAQAATGTLEEDALVFQNMGVTTKTNGKRILRVQVALSSDEIQSGMDLTFKFDTTKIQPCNKNTGLAVTTSQATMNNLVAAQNDYYMGTIYGKSYTVDSANNVGKINLITVDAGGTDIVGNGYQGPVMGDDNYDIGAAQFPDRGYYPIMDFYFVILDDSITNDAIPSDLFSLSPVGASAPTGCRIEYHNAGGLAVTKDIANINYGGFVESESEKNVTGIVIKTNPTNMTYEHGDTIDLSGGVLTVTYDDSTTEDIDMTDSEVSITNPSDGKAYISSPTVTISYGGKTASFNITVTDPIQSLVVTSPMNKQEYEQGDTIDFAGLQLTATKKSGATEVLTSSSTGLTISENVADINSPQFTQTSASGVTPVKGTQKIVFTYEGKTVNATIIVNDTIVAVNVLEQPTKVTYKRGEALDLSGAKVQITLGSGGMQEIELPDGSVTVAGYSSTLTGSKQNLSVTFAGITATNTIDVEVYNYITNATLTPPTNVNPIYDTELSLAGGSFNFTWQDGTTSIVNLTDSNVTVTGYSKTNLAQQLVTAEYTTHYTLSDGTQIPEVIEKTFIVEINNPITGITITAPTKTIYNHGESLKLDGGVINFTYASGSTATANITTTMITEADGSPVEMSPAAYDSTNKLDKKLKITYTEDGVTGTVNYPITIVNDIKSIAIHTTPTKVAYNVSEPLDVTGGEIEITRATGTPSVIPMTSSMVTNFNSAVENTALSLNVEYTENGITKTTNYTVSVKDTVISIDVQNPPTVSKYGEALDLTGVTIDIVKGSGNTSTAVTSSMISGFNPNVLGEQTVTVTYGGQTDTFKVKVQDYVTKIEVNPASVTGTYDDTLSDLINDNSIMYTITYAKTGAQSPIALVDAMVSGYNPTSTSTQSLTVTYVDSDTNSFTNGQNFTATLEVTLANSVTGITITSLPTELVYSYVDTIDLIGGQIQVTRESNTTEIKSFTDAGVTVTEVDGTPINLSNVTFGTDNTATKTVKVTYEGQSQTYQVTVINKISGIVMNSIPKTDYKISEALDLTSGTIDVTRQDGTIETISLSDSRVNVTGFDNTRENTNLQLTVSFTENGTTETTNYNVSVVDEVTSVVLSTTPKTNYKYGDSLDVSTGVLTVTRSSGVVNIPMTSNMVTELDGTPFDGTNLGTRNLKITYGGQTLTYEVNVEDFVTGIILISPTKNTYEYGESLDLTGGSVQKVMASGAATSPVELTDSSVNLSAFNSNQVGAQTIDVTYEGKTQSFAVVVEDNIQSILLKTTPKTTYKFGESLDVTGGVITAVRSSGQTEDVDVTNSMVTGFNPNQLGNQTLTITYSGKTVDYTVNVEDYVTGITLVNPNKLAYKLNEAIDLAGGQVIPQMASGTVTTPVAMTDASVGIQGFTTATEGAKTITVSYAGFTATFGISVSDPLSGMIIKELPNKLQYRYGDSLDVTGGVIELIKESGNTEIINITKDMISGYDSKILGNQTLTVTYEGLTQEFIVEVIDYISHLQVKSPTKVEYEYGQSLDLEDGTVSIIMASGKVEETIDLTASMISGYNAEKEGTQEISVEYKGLTGSFSVTVIDKVKGISILETPSKIEYQYGEELDVTGGKIQVIKSSGIYEISITKDMVSGYESTRPGFQVIKVTFGESTANYMVVVAEKPEQPQPEQPEQPQQPQKPQKPVAKPTNKPVTNIIPDKKDEPIVEETKPSTENVQDKEDIPKVEEKPTETLGVKDEKEEPVQNNKKIAGITVVLGMLFLLILILTRRNVKIYVEEDGEFVLGGIDKITKKNPKLNIDEYLDGETYQNRVKVRLSDSISEKLDGKEIQIQHKGQVIKHKVHYNDEPYEFILE